MKFEWNPIRLVKRLIQQYKYKKQLEAISSSVKLKNRSIKYYACDLLEEESVKKLAEFAKTENVKILINNAGIHCKNKPCGE